MEHTMLARNKAERIYVRVISSFDITGYMQPVSIVWPDGRVFKIEEIRDYCPAESGSSAGTRSCFTIVLKGQERYLFYEPVDPRMRPRIGRWFVEKAGGSA